MALTVLVINNTRHLINTLSKGSEDLCNDLIQNQGSNEFYFDEVKQEDLI
jgi:hypothetical protein